MLDWDDLRFFLAVARHANLTMAADNLKVAPSTVGRRIAALETDLGVRLLNRTPERYVLTLAGEEVRDKAELIERETSCLSRSIGNRDAQLSGSVRITCAESIASHVLAPCLPELHKHFPGITIELAPDQRQLSLAMREADIAVRLSPPEQQDVVQRRIGKMTFAVYASAEYLADHGRPDFTNCCRGHCAIHQLGDVQDALQADWFTDLTSEAAAAVRTSSHEVALAAVAATGGLACLARYRADQDYRLVRMAEASEPPQADLWLVMHRDNRLTARMRAVADHIAEHARCLSRA